MGVKDFFKVPGIAGSRICVGTAHKIRETITEITGVARPVALIDLSNFLFRYAYSVSDHTSSRGARYSVHVRAIINGTRAMIRCGYRPIYVFDPPNPPAIKVDEIARRAEQRVACEARLAAAEMALGAEPTTAQIERYNKCLKANFRITGEIIEEVKEVLTALGVEWYQSPDDYEAEQVAARLNVIGRGNVVMSNDADTLVFGANLLVRSIGKKYELYSRRAILDYIKRAFSLPGDREASAMLLKVALMLGTDFNARTPLHGPATVISRMIESIRAGIVPTPNNYTHCRRIFTRRLEADLRPSCTEPSRHRFVEFVEQFGIGEEEANENFGSIVVL
jgi:5'-3' exonuclease